MTPIAPLSPDVLRALEFLPDPYLILAPDPVFTILTATAAFLKSTGTSLEAFQGQPLLEAFPQAPSPLFTDGDYLRDSLQHVFLT